MIINVKVVCGCRCFLRCFIVVFVRNLIVFFRYHSTDLNLFKMNDQLRIKIRTLKGVSTPSQGLLLDIINEAAETLTINQIYGLKDGILLTVQSRQDICLLTTLLTFEDWHCDIVSVDRQRTLTFMTPECQRRVAHILEQWPVFLARL